MGGMETRRNDSRHKCLIYDGHPMEQLGVVVPLLLDGLSDHWRCLYLGDPDTVELVDDALVQRGVDTEREVHRGALVLSSDRSHLRNGLFDPIAMVDGLCASVDEAVRDGFSGLCATGDMRWELGADENFDHLLEYEAQLERVFREKPLRGICQYRRDILPARAIRDALVTHGAAYIGNTLNRDNLFYIPPELLLDGAATTRAAEQGEWMCQQIVRVLDAERKRDLALAALEDINRDLERRVAERTADLALANRHLEAFAYSVSHDLRAPLRAIKRFAEIVVEECADRLGDDARDHLARITGNAKRMGELIEGLLSLARIAQAPVALADVSISQIAHDTVTELATSDPSRAIDVVIHDDLRAKGDPVLVRAVLVNLIGNAWKFTSKRANSRIEVGASGSEGDRRIFFVRDNGAGFDMQHAQHLFDAFKRLHSDAEFPGHGIGLATVERVVTRHQGRVWAEASVGEGATFYFTLPV